MGLAVGGASDSGAQSPLRLQREDRKGRPGPGLAQTEPRISELGGTPESIKLRRARCPDKELEARSQPVGQSQRWQLHPLSSGLTWSEPLADPTKGLSGPSGLVVAPTWSL